MNKQAFAILEFDALCGLIVRHAQTEMGSARIQALEPLHNVHELTRTLSAVGEMIQLRQRGARLSLESVTDPAESISRLRIEGTALEPLAILQLANLCEQVMEARAAIAAEREICPALFEIVSDLPKDLTKLAALLKKKILPSGELDDRASPELAGIRREINSARSRITRTLENLMRRASDAVQEELVTVRNDRFVIPVRSDHQGRIKGVTHGSSSSGATVFVEPLETIEANNELQSLREAEQREIAEILFALSAEIRRNLTAVEHAAEAIGELDFINAKAAFAEKFNCVVPTITEPRAMASGSEAQVKRWDPLANPTRRGSETSGASAASKRDMTNNGGRLESALVPTDSTLQLIDARHPLLEQSLRPTGGHVVPVSFELDNKHTAMIISGANAGGKTVVLKTAGLLSLMALCGLPVPARAARVPFYRSILADIGDHQSLAANLSTFTSHVANIASMIDLCTGGAGASPASGLSLVLLDEVGTGTDPEEGSALGVAVVDHFKQRGSHVLATTHYSGLKMYAANEPGVLNASVEFDEKTLQPTYRLLVGLAGSSSGLDIAQRFGIPPEIITKAGTQVKQSTRDAIEYLRRIKREAEEAESLHHALEEERAAVAQKFGKLDAQFEKRERDRQARFESELREAITDFENRSRELLAKVEDRAERAKVERDAQRRSAELKREAQRAAQSSHSARVRQVPQSHGEEGGLPPHLRGVRVIRDGQVISGKDYSVSSDETHHISDATTRGGRGVRAPSDESSGLRIGARVRLVSFGATGIIDRIKGDEAEIRVGSLHLREKLENLELLEDRSKQGTSLGVSEGSCNEVSTPRVSGRAKASLEDLRRQATTTELHLHSRDPDSKFQTSELNLIGKTTDEAIELTDKFLDEAFLNGQREVRIIHGHGTGALRKAIAVLLSDHPHVTRFSPAPQNQGGGGATIVELRS
jgi:DNA mismatch repair protein MutS2